jgi:undecaprenyl pyrophosphate synthase
VLSFHRVPTLYAFLLKTGTDQTRSRNFNKVLINSLKKNTTLQKKTTSKLVTQKEQNQRRNSLTIDKKTTPHLALSYGSREELVAAVKIFVVKAKILNRRY